MNGSSIRPRSRRVAQVVLLLLAGLWSGPVAWGQSAAELDDESFIVRLEEAGDDQLVDRQRLARLFFGIAATLEGSKSSVRLLGSAIRVREPMRESAASAVTVRYADYATALEGLGHSAGRLLDRPDSATAIYRYLAGAHHTCWQLDAYTRTVENYGARNQDLMSILSSIEACARFRRVAYLPVVEGIVARELQQAGTLREEARSLRDELDEIERLLDDLRRLEADSPD